VRVKISYGADIDEVPEEVEQLFSYVSEKVKSLKIQTEHIEDAFAGEQMDIAIPLIEKMRRTLASLDQRLSDIDMISVGYLNYKQGEQDVPTGRPLVATTENSSTEDTTHTTGN